MGTYVERRQKGKLSEQGGTCGDSVAFRERKNLFKNRFFVQISKTPLPKSFDLEGVLNGDPLERLNGIQEVRGSTPLVSTTAR